VSVTNSRYAIQIALWMEARIHIRLLPELPF
jgi:hypothetical protein